MRKKTIVFLCVFSFCMVSLATSESNQPKNKYLFFGIGQTTFTEETDIPWNSDAGVVRIDIEKNHEVLFNGGVGCKIWDDFRIECEVGKSTFGIDDLNTQSFNVIGTTLQGGKGEIDILSFLINIWYDIKNITKITPYFGVGAGPTLCSFKDTIIRTRVVFPGAPTVENDFVDDADWQVGYQVGFGVAYELTETFIIDLSYRYFATTHPEFQTAYGDKFDAEVETNNIILSVRYLF